MKDRFSVADGRVYYTHHQQFELKGIGADGFDVVYQKQHHDFNARGYLKDDQGIWWFKEGKTKPVVTFVTDDVAHFQIIDDEYSKDSHTLYFSQHTHIAIPGSDPATFQRFLQPLGAPSCFAKDKNQVYGYNYAYGEGFMIFSDADPATFVAAGYNSFAADRDHLYHYYHFFHYSNANKYTGSIGVDGTQDAAPSEKFRLNKEFLYESYPDVVGWWHPEYEYVLEPPVADTEGYLVTEKAVYYMEDDYVYNLPFCTPVVMRSADLATFTPLDRWHGKDSTGAYYRWQMISDADVESFEAVGHHVARDHQHYFYKGRVIESVDYHSFELIKEHCNEFGAAARDKHSILLEKTKRAGKFKGYADYLLPVKNSDPASLQIINECWAKDCNNVYRYNDVWGKVDTASFEYLFTSNEYDHWAKDKNHLYNPNGKRVVKGIDGATFEVLNEFWGKDQQRVFCFVTEKVLTATDAASFQVIDQEGGAQDDSTHYWFDHSRGYPVLKRKTRSA